MELWVRSQNKEFLVKTDELFYYQKVLTAPHTALHKISTGDKTLGCYESKERCIEIIDEILRYMTEFSPNPFLYEMPEK